MFEISFVFSALLFYFIANINDMEIRYVNNPDEFKSFLLTYLAEADYEVSDEEKAIILKHVSVENYNHIKRSIDKLSDFECLDMIESHKNEYLPSHESRLELIAEMEQLYAADHKKSVLERNMILGLKKILLT